MATKRQIEEQDRASETRRTEAVERIIAATERPTGDDGAPDRGIAVGVLGALMDAIHEEASDVEQLRRKGWQSAVKRLADAEDVVTEWRDRLIDYTPPAGMPAPTTRSATADAQGIAIDHRAKDGESLDDRLAAAFGAELVPTRHIRTVLEDRGPVVVEGNVESSPIYGALCCGTDGSWTHRGGANCPKCIATYDAEHGEYTGPTTRRDEPITPTVAAEIRKEIEHDATGMDASALERINALPDATIEVSGTFDAAQPGETVITLGTTGGPVFHPDGSFTMNVERATHTVIDPNAPVIEVSSITDMSAPLNIVEPTAPAVRPRMSAAQVRAHALARASGREHRSISQVEGYSDCGTRYALRDLERPAWWNVGGKALHRVVETINRYAADGTAAGPDDSEILFLRALDAEIADQHAATPEHPMSTWRAAKRGSEHYDWWRVEGPVMVQRWVTWLSRMLADGWTIARAPIEQHGDIAPTPVIEFEARLDVGIPVPNLSIIDLALLHQQQNTLLIVDCKAGGSAPKDTFQLGVYGWSLLAAGIAGFTPTPDLANVRGAYWRARTGESVPTTAGGQPQGWPVLSMHPWPDVVQRYRDMDVMERQGVYMPNVTNFCGGCGVADLCPAKATT